MRNPTASEMPRLVVVSSVSAAAVRSASRCAPSGNAASHRLSFSLPLSTHSIVVRHQVVCVGKKKEEEEEDIYIHRERGH